MQKSGTIYSIAEVSTGRVVYIGQTRQRPEERWAQHRQRHTPLAKYLREIGLDKFKFSVVEEVSENTLNEREIFWIAEFGTMHPAGLNHKPGGRAKGTSKRVKDILSVSSSVMWADPAHRQKETERRKSVWQDPNYRAKMAAARKAMWADPEFRERMSERKKAAFAADPERRAKHAEKIRAKWADPEYKARVRAKISEAVQASSEFLAAQSGRSRKRWAKAAAM